MKDRVFVAQPIPEPALEALRAAAEVEVYPYMDRQITVDELAAGAARSDWLYVLHETHVPEAVLAANPALKGIAAMARHDPDIDFDAATRLGIPIIAEDAEGFSGVAVTTADLTAAMLLALAYRLVEADTYTRHGGFRQEQTMALMGLGCPGKTVGMIGFGRVAEQLAPRLAAFGLNLIYHKRTRLADVDETRFGLAFVPILDDLLIASDYVCVLCDYTPETHKLIGRRELDLIGSHSYLINTGRGRIVDELELIAALQDRRIAGAALDVFWDEPPHARDPHVPVALRKLNNVVLAPHNGGATVDVRAARTLGVAQNLIRAIKGDWPSTVMNPEVRSGSRTKPRRGKAGAP